MSTNLETRPGYMTLLKLQKSHPDYYPTLKKQILSGEPALSSDLDIVNEVNRSLKLLYGIEITLAEWKKFRIKVLGWPKMKMPSKYKPFWGSRIHPEDMVDLGSDKAIRFVGLWQGHIGEGENRKRALCGNVNPIIKLVIVENAEKMSVNDPDYIAYLEPTSRELKAFTSEDFK